MSHFLLAAHLFLALALIGLAVWIASGHYYGFRNAKDSPAWSTSSRIVLAGLSGLLLQMLYGAFTAGLKAGLVSSTWPLMLGRWIPGALLAQLRPMPLNLVAAPLTVAFIHRWLAIAILILAVTAYLVVDKVAVRAQVQGVLRWIAALAVLQLGFGITVVLTHVNIGIAMLHQLNALLLFVLTVFLLHRLRQLDAAGPDL